MASTIRSHRADAGLWKMLAVGILARIDAGLRCTKTDRQPIDGTGAQER
jgi:hypothetical protein